jgi:hypothetical protein
MNPIIRKGLLAVLPVVLLVSCKKSELVTYEQPDMVYIYKDISNTAMDSITYSFATKPSTVMYDTVKVPLRIMGVAKNKDREVKVKAVVDNSTATAGTHYEFLPSVIKAGQYTGFIPVLVKRSANLKTTEVRLQLEVIESNDFKPGVPNTAPVAPLAGGSLRYLVKINDYLSQPTNWSQLSTYFGTYSQVKYALIINVTGRSEFLFTGTSNPVSISQMLYFKIQCKNALEAYTTANGPLMDELGQVVTFPN